MGYPIRSDIKFKSLDLPNNWDISSEVKNYTISIIDNVPCKNYSRVFDNFFINNNNYSVICLSTSWEMGAGPKENLEGIISFLTNPESDFFFPTILVNSFFKSITDITLRSIVTRIIKRFKKSDRNKRIRIAYYAKNGRLSNYEFPSFSLGSEIEIGLKSIPKYANKASHNDYFVYDNKRIRWVKE